MGVKISELPEATSVQEEDIMPIVQNGETKKVSMSKVGGNEVFIGDTEEAPDTAKLVIDDEGVPMFSSEVVNSLSGDETAKAPSVHAVKDALSYSTSEVRIGTWIDGKPLYRKVVTGDIATTSKTLASINSMDKLISLTGMLNVPSGYKTKIPEYTNSTNFCALVLDTQNSPLITIPSNFANSTFVIIEEYTKTTDTATRSIPVQEETRNIEPPVEEPSEEETR